MTEGEGKPIAVDVARTTADPGPAATQAAAAGTPPPVQKLPRAWPSIPEAGALVVVLIAMCAVFAVTSPFFLAYDNLVNIATASAVIMMVAAPATLLLIGGQFDLSVGAGVAWVGVIVAWAAPELGVWPAAALGMLGALAVGLFNGLGVTFFGVNALITTLASLAIFRGLTKVLSDGQTLLLPGFTEIGTSRPLFNIPTPVFIAIVAVVLFFVVLRFTTYGRSIYAIGASPTAARLAGIRNRQVIFIAFMLSATMVGIAGLVQVSQLGAAAPTAATGLELSVVTAVILGGASLAGGRGTMLGTLLAVLILGVLNNGLVLLRVESFWQEVIRGVLLFSAVAFDQLRIRLSKTG